MKKRYILWMTLFFLALGCLPVSAESQTQTPKSRVVDMAGLLDEYHVSALEKQCMNIVEKYQFDIVLVTTNTLDGKSPMAYAGDYFDENDYGIGEDGSGILFLVSMEDRDYYFSTCGYGQEAFTDKGLQYIEKKIVGHLSDGQYYSAFSEFISLSDEFLEQAQKGKPYNSIRPRRDREEIMQGVIVRLVIALLIAFSAVTVMKKKLKRILPNHKAEAYVKANSFQVTRSQDLFLYRNVSRIRKESNTSSSSGGGSYTSSTGRSHGGRGGKF